MLADITVKIYPVLASSGVYFGFSCFANRTYFIG
jgi:hypothetical protein